MICQNEQNKKVSRIWVNASSRLVALISSITDLLVLLAVYDGIHSSLLAPLLKSRIHNHTALLGKLMHLLFCILPVFPYLV